jgi:hypothetical protein
MNECQFCDYVIRNFNLNGTSMRLVRNIIEYVKQEDYVEAEDAQRNLFALLDGAFGIEEYEVKMYRRVLKCFNCDSLDIEDGDYEKQKDEDILCVACCRKAKFENIFNGGFQKCKQ